MHRTRRRVVRRSQYTDSMSGLWHGLLAMLMLVGAGVVVYIMVGKMNEPKPAPAAKKRNPPARRNPAPRNTPAPSSGSPRRNVPAPRGPDIQDIVNDINVAILSREAARYREEGTAMQRFNSLATDGMRRLAEAKQVVGGKVPTHLEPMDRILAVDDTNLKGIDQEDASEVLDRTLKKVGRDQFVKFKVERIGTERDLYVFFPIGSRSTAVAAASGRRIPISKDLAIEVQKEVLSQGSEVLSSTDRKKVVDILSRGEATEPEYAYLTRLVARKSATTARNERSQFDRQLRNLEAALAAAPVPDRVVKRDGRRVEGRIVADDKSGVTVETKFGPITVAQADVRYKRTAADLRREFKSRLAAAKDYADALPQLMVWTREWGMNSHHEYVAFMMLKRNPNDRVARMAAGYQQSPDGTWELAATRAVVKRPETKAKLKPELEAMGFVFRGTKWYARKAWEAGIDNLQRRPELTWKLNGVIVVAWHLEDTPQARIINGSGDIGKKPNFEGAPRLRFLAPTGTSGTASIVVQAPGEFVECQVKAPGEIIARGKQAKLGVFITPEKGSTIPIYELDQGKNETYYDVSYQVKGKKKFTITAQMRTTKDGYHTYARFLPCLPETRQVFWVRGKILSPAPEIDRVWAAAK